MSNWIFLGWWQVYYTYLCLSHWHILFDSVRRKVRHAELDISEDYFLACLYSKGLGNPDDVEHGFLCSGPVIKVHNFSINYLPTNRTSDLLCTFHITIILRGIRWARIWRRSQLEEAEIGFSEEGNEDKCHDSSSYGRESHTEGNCICCNSGMFLYIRFTTNGHYDICVACLQSACHFTMGWRLQQLQLPRLLQLHRWFLRVWQSRRQSTCWPSFEVVESVSPFIAGFEFIFDLFRQVFPNHIATTVKSRKSRMKLKSQRQAQARPSEGL